MNAQGELRALLSSVSLKSDAGPWPEVVQLLARAFPESLGFFYDLAAGEGVPMVDRLESSSPAPGARVLIDQFMESEGKFGCYEPLRPQRRQRNRAVNLDEISTPEETERWRWHWRRWGLGRADQLRMLVCDGPLMLGWVGVYRAEGEFTPAERTGLQALGPQLMEHLRWEAQLHTAALLEAGLELCLDALARPAAVLDRRGRVVTANVLMRTWAPDEHRSVRDELQAAAHGANTRFRFKRLQGTGGTHWLAIDGGAPATRRLPWSVSGRERQVVERLSAGQSNRAIAIALGISERTVEAHVARLLAKTGCESRASLVAACVRT